MPQKPGYLPTLDGWRAVAVGLVVLGHAHRSISRATGGALDGFFAAVPEMGLLGVRIFFGISGLLICSRLIEEEKARGRISLKGFYLRRSFRILPPLMVMMAVAILLRAVGAIDFPLRQWLAGLFFAANYIKGPDDAWYLGHLWSLSVEEHFYLLWPGFLLLIGVRRGMGAATVLAIAVAVWRALAMKIETSQPAFDGTYFWGRTDIIADGLLWGCVTAFLCTSDHRERLRSLLRPAVWWPLFLFLVVTLPGKRLLHDWKLIVALFSVQAVVIPLMLAGTVLRSESTVGRVLEWKPLRWVGWLSYSIYLWQQFFLVERGRTGAAPWLCFLQQFPVNIVAILAVALVSFHLVEKPLIKLGHRLARPVTPGR